MLRFSWSGSLHEELGAHLWGVRCHLCTQQAGSWGWERGKPPGELGTDPCCPCECSHVLHTKHSDVFGCIRRYLGWVRGDGFHGPRSRLRCSGYHSIYKPLLQDSVQFDLIKTQTRLPKRSGGVMACTGGGTEARAAVCRSRGRACVQVALEISAPLAAMQAVLSGWRCGGLGCPGAAQPCPPCPRSPPGRAARAWQRDMGGCSAAASTLGSSLGKEGAHVLSRVGTHFTHLGAERRAGTYGACFGIIIPWNKQEILL